MERRRVLGHDVAYDLTARPPAPVLDPAGRQAPDVVLVHGIGVSSRYFAPLAAELSRSARVLTLDLPGFGSSPRPAAPLGIAEHADVVAALVRDLGLDRPVVVGHSMGTQVATEVALRHPDLVAALVLASPVADPRARTAAGQAWRLLRDVAHESPRGVAVQLREWARCGPRWYLATLPGMLEHRLEERIGLVTQPLALLRGENDPVAPDAYVRGLVARAPHALLAQAPHAGHLVMFRRPWHVADVTLALARGLGAPASADPASADRADPLGTDPSGRA